MASRKNPFVELYLKLTDQSEKQLEDIANKAGTAVESAVNRTVGDSFQRARKESDRLAKQINFIKQEISSAFSKGVISGPDDLAKRLIKASEAIQFARENIHELREEMSSGTLDVSSTEGVESLGQIRIETQKLESQIASITKQYKGVTLELSDQEGLILEQYGVVRKLGDGYYEVIDAVDELSKRTANAWLNSKRQASGLQVIAAQSEGIGRDAVESHRAMIIIVEKLQREFEELNTKRQKGERLSKKDSEHLARLAAQLKLSRRLRTEQRQAASRQALAGARAGTADPYNTIIQISRVIQDLPFGILGIANNLDMLVESWRRLNSEVKLTREGTSTWSVVLKGIVKSPIGLSVIVNTITSLIIAGPKIIKAWKAIKSEIEGTGDEAHKLKEAIDEASKSGLELGDTIIRAEEEYRNFVSYHRSFGPKILGEGEFPPLLGTSAIKQIFKDYSNEAKDLFNFLDRPVPEVIESLKEIYKVKDESVKDFFRRVIDPKEEISNIKQSIKENKKLLAENKKEFNLSKEQVDDITKAYGKLIAEIVTLGIAIKANSGHRLLHQMEEDLGEVEDAIKSARGEAAGGITSDLTSIDVSLSQEGRRIERRMEFWRGIYSELIEQNNDAANKFADEYFDFIDSFYTNIDAQTKAANTKRLKIIRDYWRDVEDMEHEALSSILEAEQETFDNRVRIAEAERDRNIVELRRQVEDFKGTREQIIRFRKAAGERESAIERQFVKERADIRREETQLHIQHQAELTKLGLERPDTVGSSLSLTINEKTRDLRGKILDINTEIAIQMTEMTEESLLEIERLNEQKRILEEIHKVEVANLRAQQLREDESVLLGFTKQRTLAQLDLREATILATDDSVRSYRKLIDIEQERRREQLRQELAVQLQAADEIEDEVMKLLALEEIYETYEDRKNQIALEGAKARKDIARQEVQETLNIISGLIGGVSGLATDTYDLWERKRTAELEAQGKTSEQITKIIHEEGKRRLAISRALAKAEILASGAVAAQEAFTSVMKSPLPPPLNAIAAAAFASTIFAAAVQRARAVGVGDDPNFSGGGGGSYYGFTSQAPAQTSTRRERYVSRSEPTFRSRDRDAVSSGMQPSHVVIGANVTDQISRVANDIHVRRRR